MAEKTDFQIAGVKIERGETRDVRLKVSETYTGDDVRIPVRVIRSTRQGPTVFISAAVHGDELNGTGIVHDFMFADEWDLEAGTVLLAPVVNVFGFESAERYLPDRRDLNRCFPGRLSGSLASRIAAIFMKEVVRRCDYGIDLHTAAVQQTNYPNVRGDLSQPQVQRIASTFGCELVVNNKGPAGCLRRAACRAKCATIILEAGETLKVEPVVTELGVQGIRNVLVELGMLTGKRSSPPYQMEVKKTKWVRARVGGILRFHVRPGDLLEKGQPISTNYSILGKEQNTLKSPVEGVVLGMATMPAVKPGEPVCHIALPTISLSEVQAALDKLPVSNLYRRLRTHLATSIPFESRS